MPSVELTCLLPIAEQLQLVDKAIHGICSSKMLFQCREAEQASESQQGIQAADLARVLGCGFLTFTVQQAAHLSMCCQSGSHGH